MPYNCIIGIISLASSGYYSYNVIINIRHVIIVYYSFIILGILYYIRDIVAFII